jgi:hypothetical protein
MAKHQAQGPRKHSTRMGSRARATRTITELVPLSARTHLRQARREVLLAVRDVLDHAIGRLETAARSRRLRRVRVE